MFVDMSDTIKIKIKQIELILLLYKYCRNVCTNFISRQRNFYKIVELLGCRVITIVKLSNTVCVQ